MSEKYIYLSDISKEALDLLDKEIADSSESIRVFVNEREGNQTFENYIAGTAALCSFYHLQKQLNLKSKELEPFMVFLFERLFKGTFSDKTLTNKRDELVDSLIEQIEDKQKLEILKEQFNKDFHPK